MSVFKNIKKEEWLVAIAVGLLAYVLYTRKKKPTEQNPKESEKRMVIDDPTVKREEFPTDLEQKFKTVTGNAYEPFLNDLKAIGLDKEVAIRQMWKESKFQPKAVSPKGAKGIAQFMDSTWTTYGAGGNQFSVADSLKAYPKFMKDVLAKFPNRLDLALAGYNWGANRNFLKNAYNNKIPYEQYKSGLPSETRKYVASILRP